MKLEIKPATRTAVKPLVGLFSESGAGKTYSSLLLARGLVGPTGKIVLCDSESGRGSLYADVLPGGYDTLEIGAPFSPARYIEAIETVEQSGAAVGCLDSGSHEWEGIGGVLDMAGENESRSGKAGLHNWRAPKMEHSKFVLKLLQSPIPWILCLRAKYKTRQGKDERGKTAIIKDEVLSPLQAEEFIFEMTVHGWISLDHAFHPTKISHPSLGACFPSGAPIEIRHGEMLAAWCASPGTPCNGAPKPATSPSDRALAAKELWEMTKAIHHGDKSGNGKAALQNWLKEETLIGDGDKLDDLSAELIREIIRSINTKENAHA